MEAVIIILLFVIVIELLLIYNKLQIESETKEEAVEENKGRRKTQGVFANPLGDSYRKNHGLYVPIKPGSVMLDGDEEDEV